MRSSPYSHIITIRQSVLHVEGRSVLLPSWVRYLRGFLQVFLGRKTSRDTVGRWKGKNILPAY